jgi:mannose-1-phosphate guanylyltransferase
MSDTLAELPELDVGVLAGGLGTRLASVLDGAPKVLAPAVGGTPYIAFLLDWLARSGLRRIVFCLGHRADAVEDWLAGNVRPGMTIGSVREPAPAGTAGALRHARQSLNSDPVLVMNGDSFVDADFATFLADFHASKAGASVLCVRVDNAARYGSVDVNADGWIERFSEKDPHRARPGLINAGVYLFSQSFLAAFLAGGATSLERDVFASAPGGTIRSYLASGTFHDIGTPESLAAAASILAPHLNEASP